LRFDKVTEFKGGNFFETHSVPSYTKLHMCISACYFTKNDQSIVTAFIGLITVVLYNKISHSCVPCTFVHRLFKCSARCILGLFVLKNLAFLGAIWQ